jgi:hypothetical protein
VEPSGSRATALAEKKPAPWGGKPVSSEEFRGWRAGEWGADMGTDIWLVREGWFNNCFDGDTGAGAGTFLDGWFKTCRGAPLRATYEGGLEGSMSCGRCLVAAPFALFEIILLGTCGCGVI